MDWELVTIEHGFTGDDHGSSPSTSGKTHEKTSVIQTQFQDDS